MRQILSVALVVATVAGCSTTKQRHREWLAEESRRNAVELDAKYANRNAALDNVEARLKKERGLGTDPQAWAEYADELERRGDDEAYVAAARRRAQYLASIADCETLGDLRYDPRGRARMSEACIGYYDYLSSMGGGYHNPIADLEARVRALEAEADYGR